MDLLLSEMIYQVQLSYILEVNDQLDPIHFISVDFLLKLNITTFMHS